MPTEIHENRFLNAAMHIDVKHKKVKFTYPDDASGWIWLQELLCVFGAIVPNYYPYAFSAYLLFVFIWGVNITHVSVSTSDFNFDILGALNALWNYLPLLWNFPVISFITIVFILPTLFALAAYFGREWVCAYYPRWNYVHDKAPEFMKRVAYLKDTGEKEIRIPYFNNMKIQYTAYGDYKNQLSTLDIQPVYYQVVERGMIILEEDGQSHWEAVFKFDNVPQDGYIEILFK